ncbi:putative disease resistance protein [Dorcoceras hygrometricum]|uniref:Putative disease resistance protein n=1 Tax=Dorcoceras hygrometricum TaxID=472368 RepID=A0A2Z7DEY6_9LAMI|nr:putative disease resistance protein [Dorcoceras hygrometricum]
MASSFISNALHINFDSVLGIQDNEGMVNMFKAIEASGIRGFLGCQEVISEIRFASVFNLPTNGLTDLSEVPNHLVMQARTVFARLGKPVPYSCKKRLLKYEFRLLNDILAKSITVKAGSFDVVTHERFLMMTSIHFGVKINWSKILFEVLKEMADRTIKRANGFAAQICVLLKGHPAITLGEAETFPSLKILSKKSINTYVATNKTIARGETDEPEVAKVAIVKRKSVSKKKSAPTDTKGTDEEPMEVVEKTVSKKRSYSTGDEPAVTRKKRTMMKKASLSKENLELVSVEQDVEPIYVVPAVEDIIEKEQEASTADDVDQIIAHIITETAEVETEEMFVEPEVAEGIATGKYLEEPVEPRSKDIAEEISEESMSIEDLLLQIPGNAMKVPLEDLMFTASVTTQPLSLALGELLATPINNQADATAEYNS